MHTYSWEQWCRLPYGEEQEGKNRRARKKEKEKEAAIAVGKSTKHVVAIWVKQCILLTRSQKPHYAVRKQFGLIFSMLGQLAPSEKPLLSFSVDTNSLERPAVT